MSGNRGMYRVVLLAVACAILASPSYAQRITTVAGGGAGDGGAAASARLYYPRSVAVDTSGNLFVADQSNHRIRRIAAGTGIITTVAGNGFGGFGGDGGAATEGALNVPRGVAVDAEGNLFIADYYNHRIRKVAAATGLITTVAGNGSAVYGGDGGSAVSASLQYPTSVAVDAAGNLFVADEYNGRIRKVAAGTGVISTVAGNGLSGFSGDGGAATDARFDYVNGVAVDAAGNLFIADRSNHRIRRVAAGTGIITTVAGNGTIGPGGDGGLAINANLSSPIGVLVDAGGNLFIADSGRHRIRRVAAGTGIITTVAGSGGTSFYGDGGLATDAGLSEATGVALDGSGNLFIADFQNHRVRKVTASTGVISTVAGEGSTVFYGDGGAATGATFNAPAGLAVDMLGNLFIADRDNHRVRKVAAGTGTVSTVAGNGTAGYGGDNAAATSAALNQPASVAVDAAGNLYIADKDNHRIRKVAAGTGIITTVAGNGTAAFSGDGGAAPSASLNVPIGVAVDAGGNLFIADYYNQRVRQVAAGTAIITTVAGNGTSGFGGDGGAATSALLSYPAGVAADPGGNLYVVDSFNGRIRKIAAGTGTISTVAGNGSTGFGGDGGSATSAALYYPSGVSVDANGNIFIADINNYRVRRVAAATGVISTVAGNGVAGFSGDGGPAASASLYWPVGAAVDAAGNLFIADAYAHRVRKVTFVAARGDHNADGKSDIVWRNAGSGYNYLYQMNGLALAGEGYLRNVPNPWAIAGIVDFDGDGKADLLWRNATTGDTYIFLMNGTAVVGETYGRNVPTDWAVAGVADLNGDGKADIVWRNATTGDNYVFFMNGLAIGSEGYLPNVPSPWTIATIGDFDGDGKADLFWRNAASGDTYFFLMNGLTIANQGYGRNVPVDWAVVGAGDHNGDGKADLLWRNVGTGDNYLYLLNGMELAGEGYLRNVPAPWGIVGTGDYDGDGRADILWRNTFEGGLVYLFLMNGLGVASEGYLPSVPGGWAVVK